MVVVKFFFYIPVVIGNSLQAEGVGAPHLCVSFSSVFAWAKVQDGFKLHDR